jgi:hypothetical protein
MHIELLLWLVEQEQTKCNERRYQQRVAERVPENVTVKGYFGIHNLTIMAKQEVNNGCAYARPKEPVPRTQPPEFRWRLILQESHEQWNIDYVRKQN